MVSKASGQALRATSMILRCATLLIVTAVTATAADLSRAVVRQKVNVVTLAPSLAAPAQPVSEGAVVRDDNVVRTGNDSRAELEFSDLTLTRLGANAIFSFDAQARTLECTQGAALFSKPTNSGRVEIRAGAVTGAITGSTGFVSNQPARRVNGRAAGTSAESRTAMIGMLEGRFHGSASWRDNNGRERRFTFKLGAGEMIVAQPGRQPVVVQFDIARFLATSPLVKGFRSELPNQAQISRAVAEYRADESRGFVDQRNVMVSSQPVQVAWVAPSSTSGGAFDASVYQLSSGRRPDDGGFVPIGGSGVIRGQLVWDTTADLDLHLILPDKQEVYYANPNVTFNNGRATATLDHDNVGNTVDVPPSTRVENIVVNGVPQNGDYTFFVNSFSSPNSSDNFTLRVGSNGQVQVINGTLTPGQSSTPVVIPFHSGGG